MTVNGATPLARCADCRFYDPRATVCRQRPPVAIPMPVAGGKLSSLAIWPPVDADRDWCGSYQEVPSRAGGEA